MNALHVCILIFLGILFLATILHAVYKGKLRIAYSLLWVTIGLLVLCTPFFFTIFEKLHCLAGWPTPTSMLFLFGILLILLLLFNVSVILSAAWREHRLMSRQIALLTYRIEQLEKDAANAHDVV